MSTFKELGIHPNLVKRLTEMGIVTPTPVQEATIARKKGRTGTSTNGYR